MGPLVRLSNVSVVREGKTILKRTSLTVMEGEHVAIVGPNGAGKSTLVKLMTGEIYPFRGEGSVTFSDGMSKSEQRTLRTELTVVSSDAMNQLIADPTVRELLISGFFGTFGVLWSYEVESKHEVRAQELARQLNIENLYDRKLSTLSSGEARRAWIGRALAPKPKGLILDEPTAHLDASAMEQFRETLYKVAAGGVTLVLVTHHYEEITPLFQRIIVLREGEIVADGSRAELLESKRINKLLNPLSQAREVTQPHSPQEYLEAIKQAPVYDVAIKTPFEHAPMISQRLGNSVFLKREDRQAVFSFKLRGAYALMATLSKEDLEKGVIAASAGNHAQGVALAAKTLGAKATIVVPKTTPSVKTDAILFLGANLILHGDSYDEAHDFARKLAEQDNLTYVHPYDQPHVIAGQGTVGLEIHEQAGALDVVFVAVGGGGLISGVALALKQLRPGVKVIGVEPEDSDAMHRSLAAHQRIKLDRVGLLADGVAVKLVGEETFRIAKDWVDEVILVSNDQICGAVKEIFEDRRAVLEPSGALAFAGLKKYVEREKIKGQSLCAIACGANLNFDRLRYIAERAQVGERRETILAVKINEEKGSFRAFCSALGHRNVTEFNYRMGDESQAVVFVGIATKSDEEHAQLVESLEARNYRVADLTGDELATTHLRHMVGGRAAAADLERLYHFDFPEREGALEKFLRTLGDRFNISLFHYRNHGSDVGRVLVGFQIPSDQREVFDTFRRDLGYPSSDVTDNVGLSLFLR